MKRLATWVLVCAFVVAVWEGIILATGVPHFILPSLFKVADTLIFSRGLIADHAVITIIEVVAGLAIGTIFGAATALAIFAFPLARRVFEPVMVFTQAVPVFALAPILTLWLGYGMASKIFMAVLITYFPVASNFYDGLARTDRSLVDLAKTMGANSYRTLLLLRVPHAVPALASGIKLATVYAPIGAVIGEWVGASKGLGYLMLLANGRAKIDLMFAALFVLALFTLLLHWFVGRMADRASSWSLGT